MATIAELAKLTGAEIVGDPELEIRALAPLDKAGSGDISFLANKRYAKAVQSSSAAALISDRALERSDITYLVCPNPYLAFAKVLTHLHAPKAKPEGISSQAHVAESAVIGDNVTVKSGAVIGERVQIGSGSIIHPNVVIYADVIIGSECILHAGALIREGSVLGDRVILQPGAVIGSDGFGFAPDGEEYYKIPQVGHVVIEDDVEIGANTCVDRGTMGQTVIASGCKLDNMVQVGHNVTIGANTVMAAQGGIAGSSRIGKHCTFGGRPLWPGTLKQATILLLAHVGDWRITPKGIRLSPVFRHLHIANGLRLPWLFRTCHGCVVNLLNYVRK